MKETDVDSIEALTEVMLRLLEAHRQDKGSSDLHIGIRGGLLTALNIVISVKADVEAKARLEAEA